MKTCPLLLATDPRGDTRCRGSLCAWWENRGHQQVQQVRTRDGFQPSPAGLPEGKCGITPKSQQFVDPATEGQPRDHNTGDMNIHRSS